MGLQPCATNCNTPTIETTMWSPKTVGLKPFECLLTQGVVYIMDHEVIPCCSKLRDWPLHSSPDNFDLHQGKKMQV